MQSPRRCGPGAPKESSRECPTRGIWIEISSASPADLAKLLTPLDVVDVVQVARQRAVLACALGKVGLAVWTGPSLRSAGRRGDGVFVPLSQGVAECRHNSLSGRELPSGWSSGQRGVGRRVRPAWCLCLVRRTAPRVVLERGSAGSVSAPSSPGAARLPVGRC